MLRRHKHACKTQYMMISPHLCPAKFPWYTYFVETNDVTMSSSAKPHAQVILLPIQVQTRVRVMFTVIMTQVKCNRTFASWSA